MAQATVNGQDRTVPSLNGINPNGGPETVVIDLLIIGTGPAGASLASFLTSHGKQALVSKANILTFFRFEGNDAGKCTG
jgi:hypothetical protein